MKLPAGWRPTLIVLAALALFPLTERGQLRAGSFPGVEDASWRSLNNYTLLFLEMWRENGAWSSGFGLGLPMDVADFRNTKPYSSYPPGYLLAPWLAEKLTPAPPADFESTLARLQVITRLNHFLFACIAGWAALALAGELAAALAAVVAALFLPPFLLFLHNVWWVDLAGLTFSALFFLLHLGLRQRPRGPLGEGALGLSVLAGGLMDWFSPVLGVLGALNSRKRQRLAIAAGLLLAALLFVFQQWELSGLWVALYKFRVRSGMQGGNLSLPQLLGMWLETVRKFLGWGGVVLPPLAIALAACLKGGRERLKAFWPLPVAVLCHWLVFNQHYPGHFYNTVRWAFLLCLLPALFPRWFGRIAAALLVAWTFSTYPLFVKTLEMATTSDLTAQQVSACRLVERHHSADSLFVSGEFHFYKRPIDLIWFFPLCKSMVTDAAGPEDVQEFKYRRFLQFRFSVAPFARTFFLGTSPPAWARGAKEIDRETPWHLYELPPP